MAEAKRGVIWLVMLLLLAALTGCISGENEPIDAGSTSSSEACRHPYPCEGADLWPAGLEGPFDVLEPERVTVESFDGTVLSGALWRPDVPDGVQVPVVIVSSPYPEQIAPSADQPSWIEDPFYILGDLLENGHAVAIFNVRGTGHSEGCFDFWGTAEQRDQPELVHWAAEQPWSNGRVALYGLSYEGTTPWQAAIHAPQALKTIVPAGIITQGYLTGFTPQGAAWPESNAFALWFGGAVGMGPRFTGGLEDPASLADHPGVEPCPQSLWALSGPERSTLLDERDATWIQDRAMLDHFDEITASVLYTAGYADGLPHQFQDDTVWHALTNAPKRMVTGEWGHQFPSDHVDGWAWDGTFAEYQLAWFDYWLKGRGDPQALGIGTVSYETGDGIWATSDTWPPRQARDEALYLADGSLQVEPGQAQTQLVNAPTPGAQAVALCSQMAGEQGMPTTATYTVEIEEPVEFAGNPVTYLNLSADGPGGVVGVDLWATPASQDPCLTSQGVPTARSIAHGAADLRYHQGNLAPKDFPTGTPTPVRVDLWSTGMRLEPGEVLALTLSWDPVLLDGKPLAGRVTVHGGADGTASHVVLPIVNGTLGGQPAGIDYPERPFAPGYPN
ncbi:MAG: CocE/NonD family hydrolase [Candidatus Thermoplasmatota archaeon]|nr:CocE/NonD family hydrolase [Candidatus Thermoplasmatota archaeon]